MTSMPPEPPPTGELRKVNRRYRCDICGVEVRLTMAPDQDPPPPRHCLEDMTEIAPLYDLPTTVVELSPDLWTTWVKPHDCHSVVPTSCEERARRMAQG